MSSSRSCSRFCPSKVDISYFFLFLLKFHVSFVDFVAFIKASKVLSGPESCYIRLKSGLAAVNPVTRTDGRRATAPLSSVNYDRSFDVALGAVLLVVCCHAVPHLTRVRHLRGRGEQSQCTGAKR